MLDLGALRLQPGGARHEPVLVALAPVTLGGLEYRPLRSPVEAVVELQPAEGAIYLKLSLGAAYAGPCVRCLDEARVDVAVDASEYQQHAAARRGEQELACEYLAGELLDVDRWAHDAVVLALPGRILCASDCPGLCPRCGVRLAGEPLHSCGEADTDSRWDTLKDLL